MKYISLFFLLFIISCGDNSSNNNNNNNNNNNSKDTTYSVDQLRIKYVIPNPTGTDDYKEEFGITNKSDTVCNKTGWYIIDDEKGRWSLDKILPISSKTTVSLKSHLIAQLLNSGDIIYLYSPTNKLVQTVNFGKTNDGDTVKTDF